MICGPLHTYGDAPTVAGTNLNIVVPRLRRPAEIRTVALKRSDANALTITLTVTYGQGWGPFAIVIATGITAAEWNQELNFAVPIGSDITFTTTGLGGAATIEGAVVVEEMRM